MIVIQDLEPEEEEEARNHMKSFIETMCPGREPEWGLKHSYDY